MTNKDYSKIFTDAIRTLAKKPENIDNLELYLNYHFDIWMIKFANNPAGISEELAHFAKMDI